MGKAGWVLTTGVGAIALAAGLYVGLPRSPPQEATTLMALTLPDTQGREQALSQWKGKVIVVNFWATWCEPCREEMPEFVQTQGEFGGRGVQFVGIAIDELDKVSRFEKTLQLNYPVLIGGYGAIELSKTLGNRLAALPFTVIVDRHGNVAHTQLGRLKPPQLRSILMQLL
jgi:peroxiredoxin